MSILVYYNGRLIPEREVCLSPRDRAYLYGEGLFETLRVTQGKIPFLHEHACRLEYGRRLLGFPEKIKEADLKTVLQETLLHNRIDEGALRLSLSRENDETGQASSCTHLLISPRFRSREAQSLSQRGAHLTLHSSLRVEADELSSLKTSSYLRYLRAGEQARAQGFDEVLLLNGAGRVVEGSRFNFFMRERGVWKTPPLSEGPLAGVMRSVWLNLFKKHHVPYEESPIDRQHLISSECVFLCNALDEMIFVKTLEGKELGAKNSERHLEPLRVYFSDELQARGLAST